MFKPHRGSQKPFLNETNHGGINHFKLIKFLQDAQRKCADAGEEDSAFRMEMLVDYFTKDYEPGKPLKFTPTVLGF
jgi:hypothetical protein